MQYTYPEKYNQTKPKLYAIHMSGEVQPNKTKVYAIHMSEEIQPNKTKVHAIHMSGEIQLNKTKAVCNTHVRRNTTKQNQSCMQYTCPEKYNL
jgi:uncharacterized pyridoxal phosphate-containing UPF0001 family protein